MKIKTDNCFWKHETLITLVYHVRFGPKCKYIFSVISWVHVLNQIESKFICMALYNNQKYTQSALQQSRKTVRKRNMYRFYTVESATVLQVIKSLLKVNKIDKKLK